VSSSVGNPGTASFAHRRSAVNRHRSCGAARQNVGLDQASGEFVAFLDADDRWLPRKLERQVLLLRSEALVGLVFSDFVRFNETEYLPNAFSFFPEIRSFPSRPSADGGGRVVVGDAFEVLLRFQFFPTFAQVTMFRRSLLGDLRFPTQLRMSEDLYFLMRLYERTEVAIIDDPLAEVRRHGKNISHSHLEQRLWDLKALRILEADAAPEHRKEVRARLAVAHAGTGYHFFWRRQPLKAARHYFSAMAYPGKRFNALVHLAALPISVFLPPRQTIE